MELRKRGVPVYHANADALLFGDGLRDVLRRARVVLSLAYFGDADEWKATRYLPSTPRGPSSSPRRAARVWSGRPGARPWCLWRASRPWSTS